MSVYWGVIGGRERKEGVSGWKEQHAKNIFAAGRGDLEVVLGEKKSRKRTRAVKSVQRSCSPRCTLGTRGLHHGKEEIIARSEKKKTGKDQLGGATDL
jgi:hypothetical protein